MNTQKKSPLWAQFSQFPSADAWPRFNGQPVPLGGMTVEHFLQHYWHKKPLLIRQAIPEFQAFFTPEDALNALHDENFESRLVTQDEAKGWQLKSGPLKLRQIPSRKKNNWTALIQGVDLNDAAGHALIQLFRFIPDARLDDLMISFATHGGGVGPHYDSYDVFLLQAHGQRHWRIGEDQDLTLVPNMPLKILQNFIPSEEFILEPGDMLYLPPHCAHDGVAMGDCMTYSIGFRAPSYRELGVALLNFVEDNIELEGRYADPELKFQTTPAQLPIDMIDNVFNTLEQLKWDKGWVAECLGCYLSEPKNNVWFDTPSPISINNFKKKIKKQGVVLSKGSKMLYHEPWVFINGEHLVADGQDALVLHKLANDRGVGADVVASFEEDSAIWQVLHDWYAQGWLELVA
ncbi:JmjC domain-containing protein [Hydromonas duriensis]|uniref:50S ribosomal protein L16 3-hydroxylase n=1 Tax=Hydromonas duriensis TaxID=1527608 RepID=A0A4R6Y8H5_9BURK|nr:cupin domain-containing protein [Hydromonas duriensis]TDR31704.1 50S ribosomal protein L16 3-hydroxylase [Hydromonas duriensis]